MPRFTIYQDLLTDDGSHGYILEDSRTNTREVVESLGQALDWVLADEETEAAFREQGQYYDLKITLRGV